MYRQNMGSGGFCFCPKCGYKKAHKTGTPCREEKCPNCGVILIREGSLHDEKIKEKQKSGD